MAGAPPTAAMGSSLAVRLCWPHRVPHQQQPSSASVSMTRFLKPGSLHSVSAGSSGLVEASRPATQHELILLESTLGSFSASQHTLLQSVLFRLLGYELVPWKSSQLSRPLCEDNSGRALSCPYSLLILRIFTFLVNTELSFKCK